MTKRSQRKDNSTDGGAVEMKFCKQCGEEKLLSDFYPERKGIKVHFCWDCASSNMREWARGKNVGRMPDQIREIKD